MTLVETLVRIAEPWATAYGNSKWLMNGVMFGHVGGFLAAGGLAIAADRAMIRAARAGADARRVHLSEFHAVHAPVLLALAVTFATGVLLFLADVETFATAPVFWVKMGFLALLLVNGSGLRKAARRLDPSGAPDRDWQALRRSAAASTLLWMVAVLTGVMLVNL
jgi:amino acid transporter